MFSLARQFQTYLEAPQPQAGSAPNQPRSPSLSASTIKNYVSDINHLLGFLSQTLQQQEIKPEHLTPASIKAYQKHLQASGQPNTTDRRLSSLRKFGEFLVKTKHLQQNPCRQLLPLQPQPSYSHLIGHFKKHLKSQKLAPSTIKNYLSDIKNYLLWAQQENNLTEVDL
jgi:site-specific recombinase XerD